MGKRIVVTSSFLVACLVAVGCGGVGSTSSEIEDDPSCTDDCPAQSVYWVKSGERTGEAARKPWSSWWYPLWQDTLFKGQNGEMSTLEKYDAWNTAFGGVATTAADYERTELYDPRAASWSGLCDAWALASILQGEPTTPVLRGNITFTVGDQKALLLKTYEKVAKLGLIGTRFNGEWNDVYADVYPQDLHRVIEEELLGKRRAFIIDEDAGPEVWNEPAWKVITRVVRDAKDEHLAHVRTWLFLASPHVDDRNYVGTVDDTREYTYDLKGSWEGDRFEVTGGAWTDRSQWDHPDYAILVPDNLERGSLNPQIKPELVDRIVEK